MAIIFVLFRIIVFTTNIFTNSKFLIPISLLPRSCNILVLRIQLILMRIRICFLDPHWKKVMSLRFTEFFNEAEFSNFLSYFFRFSFFNSLVCPLGPYPWIQEEVKILRIQRIRIRILSSAL